VALLYQATLNPTKLELLEAWTPHQPWIGDADTTTLEAVGSYRFDDPDGEVGMETHLLRTADGQILQVPVTYRGAPVPGSESLLIATTQHSVLGERWVYDACGDPVYVRALATAVLSGGTQAAIDVVTDNGQERWPATTEVSGSGSPDTAIPGVASVSYSNQGTTTVIGANGLELTLVRTVDSGRESDDSEDMQRLIGTWPGRDTPALLALARIT
jgi:Maltokinase N-terminal cap domain